MSEKLKFLMITTFYPPYNFGGDGIFVYRLSNALAKQGHKVDIIHCLDAFEILAKKKPQGEYSHHENITVHSLKSSFDFLSPLFTQQTSHAFFKGKKIQALIAEKQFDVIHYHNMSLIGLEALTFGKAIKLYTMHEHWLVCPMHILWKYNREVCTKPNCISCQLFGKRPIQWWRFSDIMAKTLAHVDSFISPSIFTKNKHRELGLNIPIAHIPNFVANPDRKSIKESLDRDSRPYFLFVGRLEKIKGLQNLIPVFRRNTTWNLLVAGEGEYADTLRKLAGDAPNIKFLGRQPYDKLQSFYYQALAVIVPSICYEVFPLIIVEAFSMGVPVIVNNLGSLPEIVQESGGGFIYNNEEELIEQMEQLYLNQKLRRELGTQGYQAYKNHFTEASHLKKYYQVIQNIAKQKNITNSAIDML